MSQIQPIRPFRLLITGSRTWGVSDGPEGLGGQDIKDLTCLTNALDYVWEKVGYRDPVLVHGAARGADTMASFWWGGQGRRIEAHPWDQKYARYGRRGGIKRNEHMVNLGANLCLAFIRDNSPGATHCANYAESKGIKVVRYHHGS